MFNRQNANPDTISLLWRSHADSLDATSTATQASDDLRVKVIADTITPHPDYTQFIRKTLMTLLTDVDTLTYRHTVLEDCLSNDDFTADLQRLLPMIRGLHEFVSDIRARKNEISVVLSRLTELENYVECVQALHKLLKKHQAHLNADGWARLYQQVDTLIHTALFQQMADELPDLRANIREVVSVTIGVNLSPDLKPIGATLLSLNKTRFKGPRFFPKLWGTDTDKRGITTLRESPQAYKFREDSILADRREMLDRLSANALFNDLARILDDVIRPISRALQKYTRVNSAFLRYIEPEIAFYIGSVKLIKKMRQRGLPMTPPTILPQADRRLSATGLYNLDLALRLSREHPDDPLTDHIVGNDVSFAESGRIQILTGPNRGGKTTYTQSIGLLHVLAQTGLYVPAENVEVSPVDAVYLHFPVEENPTMESGRLGEEAKRLRDIFSQATAHSLILLNESLASTSATESYYLARDIVSTLRMLGARAVFVTHLHELAEDCDEINAEISGDSTVQSVVSVVDDSADTVKRTYKVVPAPPRGRSYAREIAQQYGISFEQLQALLNDRDMLDE